jgi:hypothetical protein
MPDFDTLPEGADVAVELYGKAILLQLDGLSKRVYTERFEFVSFPVRKRPALHFLPSGGSWSVSTRAVRS